MQHIQIRLNVGVGDLAIVVEIGLGEKVGRRKIVSCAELLWIGKGGGHPVDVAIVHNTVAIQIAQLTPGNSPVTLKPGWPGAKLKLMVNDAPLPMAEGILSGKSAPVVAEPLPIFIVKSIETVNGMFVNTVMGGDWIG